MSEELADFEEQMSREINAFLDADPPGARPTQARRAPSRPQDPGQSAKAMKTGHVVKLAVRTKQLEMDTVFEHHSSSISRLEAQMEAEKAARQAGYPIIGYVVDIQRL
ncbi:hypothetical protein [Halomonas sp. M4R1S46]|uniref:hypothetical protein n=1 Tax=Halomonas sp. M4R1S46 TaxID=2982692 RepID=UPI0021E4A426|nr:hypothetical protein [Halomonas sp. M4R1S46]UYG08668.1 hypothetical protein OCT48_04855 [Halomonas sp. M4R1S46]